MLISGLRRNPRGSIWHRWDPHLHAPGTLLNDQFGGNWETYLQRIELSSPPIRALGVTDYFCIQTYRHARRAQGEGRLSGVALLFPNVEIRLDIKTEKKKPINLHLLFCPDDPNHEFEIERILGQLEFEYSDRSYHCTLPDLEALGAKFLGKDISGPSAIRNGANQFKTTLTDIRELFRKEQWLRQNCLVAVAGSSNDGTSGLQGDDSYAATRREIERFAHIIFASTPSQIDFWLGRTANHGRTIIEKAYGALKPCLHGSDAHECESVGSPALDRFCWLKGDLSFESLKQTVIEPAERVWIGPTPPHHAAAAVTISQATASEAPWLATRKLELNPGLIAIIGARGSGKTALAEIIATGAHAIGAGEGPSSFVVRASRPVDHLGEARVRLDWTDGSDTNGPLKLGSAQDFWESSEEAQYLSQHFVERLCSASGLAIELRAEMERVIFDSTEQTERFETDSFDGLLALHVRPISDRRTELQHLVQSISDEIAKEDLLKSRLPVLRSQREAMKKQMDAARIELGKLVPKGQDERAALLAKLESACTYVEAAVETLRKRRLELDDLVNEVTHIRTSREPSRHAEMQRTFAEAGLTEAQWAAFEMVFRGKVDSILQEAKKLADIAIKETTEGVPGHTVDGRTPLESWPLKRIIAERDRVKKEVGIDAQQQKKYTELQRTINQQVIAIKRLDAQITNAEGAEARRKTLLESRREAYGRIFGTLVEEEQVLESLYAPLARNMANAEGTVKKLEFSVRRDVDMDGWVKAGEALLDFRKDSEFRGIGALRQLAEQYLLNAWRSGSEEAVATAMDAFRSRFWKGLLASIPNSIDVEEQKVWTQSVAAWLYSTNHIAIRYGIEYEGVAIEQLSPGTRGIVLLLLYLVVDLRDTRPLLIDQPEENLDPKPVFEELVPHFRDARKRRQVIIVTHNANLVVNTDADQVIVAQSERNVPDALPTISYESGALENPIIRGRVCQILEGGQRAFVERARRYRLHWEDSNTAQ